MKLKYIVAVCCIGLSSIAESDSLVEVYADAKSADYQWKVAESSSKALNESKKVLRSGLYPKVDVEGRWEYYESDREVDVSNPFVGNEKTKTETDSYGYSVSLRQTIFDLSEIENFRRGGIVGRQANLSIEREKQALIVRTVSAYLDVLKAGAELDASLSAEKSFGEQLNSVKAKYNVGLGKTSDLLAAKAAYQSAIADKLVAEKNLDVAFELLKIITGKDHKAVDAFPERYSPSVAEMNQYRAWMNEGVSKNLDVLAAKLNERSAKSEYKSTRYRNLPRVVGRVGYEDTNNERKLEDGRYDDTYQQGLTASLTVSMPIFAGGGNQASARQAKYRYLEERDNSLYVEREVQQIMQSLFLSVVTGEVTIQAREIAIQSSESALDSVLKGYESGVESMTDVLAAQRTYFSEVRNYSSALHEYFLSAIRLKEVAGLLNEKDIQELSGKLNKIKKVNNPAMLKQIKE